MVAPPHDDTDRLWSALGAIDKRLQSLDSRFADVQASIAEIRAIYQSHDDRLDRIERCIYGNGNGKGLITQVAVISAIVYGFLFIARELVVKLL